MFKKIPLLMDAAEAGGSGGGGADGSNAGASDGGAAAQGSSALATGAANPADAWPEKFRTMGADGAFDLSATAQKTLAGYSELEKRFGSGDLPPKSPDEYAFAGLHESIKVDDLKKDPQMQSFLKNAHAAGFTDKQVVFAIQEHARMLNEGGFMGSMNADQAQEHLGQIWTDNKVYAENIKASFAGAEAIGKKAGIPMHEIEASGLGNNPVFIRMMAAIAPELGEDAGVSTAITATEEQSIEDVMKSDAYLDPKHKEHEKAAKQVKAFFDKKYGAQAVI